MDQPQIGKFISEMRKKQGLTQKQLAELFNVTNETISKWETGLSQQELADKIHVMRQTVSLWERGQENLNPARSCSQPVSGISAADGGHLRITDNE